jgi:sulfite reductase (NADPH) hemoprotein beta-component
VLVGGGLGYTHNNRKTFPRLGSMLGFVHKDKAKHVAEMVMVVQRDYGDRSDRKHARLKYTVHDHGVDWFRKQVEDLLGFEFESARPFEFTQRTDELGWMQNEAGWHMGLYIEGGRVRGKEREGLLKIAEMNACRFRMTCNESLILTHIKAEDKAKVVAVLDEYGPRYKPAANLGGLRKGAFACAALPMCVMAFAEAERYLPELVSKLEVELEKCGLFEDEIVIRMTGCPNSCGRPEMAEIGLVGVAPGMYKLYLGGDHLGTRANRIYKEGIDEAQILECLTPLFADYAASRQKGERFGNFLVRTGVVKENKYGPDYHDF